MSWWKKLFSGPAKAQILQEPVSTAPSYDELVEENTRLRERMAKEKREWDAKRRMISGQAALEQSIVRRYRAALEFYAASSSWRPRGFSDTTAIDADRGHKAKAALGKT